MAILLIGVLTCSDSCANDEREDTAGKAILDECAERGWDVVAYDVVPDDEESILGALIEMADVDEADVVLTTGGTGLGPRDVTPEATLTAADREVPGVADTIRSESLAVTPRAMLSRGVAAQRGRTLIINLPGSEKAARETLAVVVGQLEHAVEMIAGEGHA